MDNTEDEEDFIEEDPIDSKTIGVFHANLDGFRTHAIDIEAEIEMLNPKPEIILLNETKTDEGVLSLKITGYDNLCKRDRGSNGGGISVFVRKDITNQVSLLESSEDWERCWFLLHTQNGPYLICCWYRPPREPEAGMLAMQTELRRLRDQSVGTIIIGDLNAHQKRWLRYSADDTPAGAQLYNIAADEGLKQIVREPTRYTYLLDLVLTDIPGTSAKVGGIIRDHRYVLTQIKCNVPKTRSMKRRVEFRQGGLASLARFVRGMGLGVFTKRSSRRGGNQVDEANIRVCGDGNRQTGHH